MVDPVTVTYSVINITSCVLQAAKNISDLRDKYQNAANTITSICAESSSISASLSQIQGLLIRDASNLESHFDNRPELRETFDTALTGCTVIYACLEEEIHRLQAGARDADAMTWKVKCRFIWREDTMRDLLSQLRGQQMALNLLIQMLQLESLTELKQLMRDNNAMMSKVAQRSKSLRQTHPLIRVSSVFSKERDSVIDNASTIGQTEFEFDDAIVNSRAYRRALAAAQNRPSTGRSVTEPPPESLPSVEKLKIEDPTRQPEKEQEDLSDSSSGSTERIGEIDPPMPERKFSEPLPERKISEDTSSVESPNAHSERDAITRSRPASPTIKRKPLQRKPLPSGRHVLVSSPSVYTLSSVSTAPPPYQESSFYDGSDTASQVSTATTTMSSVFSTGSNHITNLSSISLPETIESDSESDDAHTLIERVSSSGAGSQTSFTSDNTEISSPELRSIQQQLTMSETSYLNKLNILRTFIEEPVSRRFPETWSHFSALHHMATIRKCSTTHLLDALKTHPANSSTLLKAFRRWSRHATTAYQTYFAQYPHTSSAIRAASETDPTFAKFVETFNSTHSLDHLLRQPLRRLADYHQTWARILLATTTEDPATTADLHSFATSLATLKTSTDAALASAQHAADLLELHRRIHALDPPYAHALDFAGEGRQLLRQAPLACRTNAKGPWRPVRVVLLDSLLFFGRWEPRTGGCGSGGPCASSSYYSMDAHTREMWYSKKNKAGGEKALLYLERPMPVKEVQCSISGAPRKPGKASVLDGFPRGTELWAFFVQTEEVVHLLAATTEAERREWMMALQQAGLGC